MRDCQRIHNYFRMDGKLRGAVKASELIERLQVLIKEYGDLPIESDNGMAYYGERCLESNVVLRDTDGVKTFQIVPPE